MTDVFAAFHPGSAYRMLDHFLIGEIPMEKQRVDDAKSGKLEFVDKSSEQKRFEKGYRDLRTKLVMAGMFKTDFIYYIRKVLEVLAIVGTSWALLHYTAEDSLFAKTFYPTSDDAEPFSDSSSFTSFFSSSSLFNVFNSSSTNNRNYSRPLWVELLPAFVLALFWQQCGWLAHDFLHHQVFTNRTYGDLAGIMIGNVFQGFSVAWWKDKHNTHHAVPNLVGDDDDAHDGDPDIDTDPLLCWSLKMANKVKNSSFGRFMISNQATFYFPILLVARISWLIQSFEFNFTVEAYKTQAFGYKAIEKFGLFLHYLWYGALMLCYMSPLRALLYFFASQCFTGFLLAIVFGP